jgi:hypothetical protein
VGYFYPSEEIELMNPVHRGGYGDPTQKEIQVKNKKDMQKFLNRRCK